MFKNKQIISFFTLLFLFLFTQNIIAQVNDKEQKDTFWSRVNYGGGFGMSFTNSIFNVSISPSAIYNVNESLALGASLNGSYISRRDVSRSTILGGGLIGLFNVFQGLQLSTDFDYYHVSRRINTIKDNYWVPALFIGAGYRYQNFSFGLRYDVLYDDQRSVYSNAFLPFVRVFF